MVGRLLIGLGIGISAVVVPAYLGELSPAKMRGRIVEVYEVLLCFGMLAAVLADAALVHAPNNWRWMVGLPVVPGMVLSGACPSSVHDDCNAWPHAISASCCQSCRAVAPLWAAFVSMLFGMQVLCRDVAARAPPSCLASFIPCSSCHPHQGLCMSCHRLWRACSWARPVCLPWDGT